MKNALNRQVLETPRPFFDGTRREIKSIKRAPVSARCAAPGGNKVLPSIRAAIQTCDLKKLAGEFFTKSGSVVS